MQMNALVSVVIPTYNHAHFLVQSLQSVLDQTYPHWEALVVDNHSQDNTDEVVRGFGDPRIRLLKIHNQGVIAASRNLGIREAAGKWIAFLDSDDRWYPQKLQIVMAAAEPGDAYDVLSTDEVMVDARSGARTILRYGPYEIDFYRILLVEGNRLSPSATVIRRVFLARHGLAFNESPDYVTVEDYGFWLDVARAGARFKFIRDVQGEYLIHGDNNSTRLARHWKNSESLLRDHVFGIQRFDASPENLWKQIAVRLELGKIRPLIANGESASALGLGLKTLVNFPCETARHLYARSRKKFRMMNS